MVFLAITKVRADNDLSTLAIRQEGEQPYVEFIQEFSMFKFDSAEEESVRKIKAALSFAAYLGNKEALEHPELKRVTLNFTHLPINVYHFIIL